MKTKEEILQAIADDKEIQKGIKKLSHYSNEDFFRDCERWISAVKEGRLMCSIKSVSRSGMSRVFYYFELKKSDGSERSYIMQFYSFLKATGHTESRAYCGSITVGGCGMDMNFHTNYSIIHRLSSLGFITPEECSQLSQQTPHIV